MGRAREVVAKLLKMMRGCRQAVCVGRRICLPSGTSGLAHSRRETHVVEYALVMKTAESVECSVILLSFTKRTCLVFRFAGECGNDMSWHKGEAPRTSITRSTDLACGQNHARNDAASSRFATKGLP
ncbi:hypothetical protein IF1G_01162 [Cordyceps javanica]|uniref:Uncharacterized protein n=1 Tax=Cordyceps javanica TaxID=43265 RepID=A0A545VHN9_9HYPO|nr:hypothetical protein IF1G_01162 [Cordyceps javanica]